MKIREQEGIDKNKQRKERIKKKEHTKNNERKENKERKGENEVSVTDRRTDGPTDRRMDRRTDGPTDGHNLL